MKRILLCGVGLLLLCCGTIGVICGFLIGYHTFEILSNGVKVEATISKIDNSSGQYYPTYKFGITDGSEVEVKSTFGVYDKSRYAAGEVRDFVYKKDDYKRWLDIGDKQTISYKLGPQIGPYSGAILVILASGVLLVGGIFSIIFGVKNSQNASVSHKR